MTTVLTNLGSLDVGVTKSCLVPMKIAYKSAHHINVIFLPPYGK